MAAWILALLLHFAPVDRHEVLPTWEWETAGLRQARYAQIAADVDEVVASSKPLPGMDAEATALLVATVAVAESGLQPDADLGPCFRGVVGKVSYASRCDGGNAVGVMQVRLPKGEQAAAFANRKMLLRKGLEGLRTSLRLCRKLEPHLRLALYNSGNCSQGRAYSARVWGYYLTAASLKAAWQRKQAKRSG